MFTDGSLKIFERHQTKRKTLELCLIYLSLPSEYPRLTPPSLKIAFREHLKLSELTARLYLLGNSNSAAFYGAVITLESHT